MLKKLQQAFVDEARICLQRLGSAKDPVDIAAKFAHYRQAVVSLRILAHAYYPKDKESREACHVANERMIADMETEEITQDGGEPE